MLVLIAAGIGGFSLYQQSVLNEHYALRSRFEWGTRSVLTISTLATSLTAAAETFRLNPDPVQIAGMEEARRKIEERSDLHLGRAVNQDRRKIYQDMRDDARALKPELERLAVASVDLGKAKLAMFKAGDELSRALEVLISAVRARRMAFSTDWAR
ncbi:MAG: chemotaxis protein, partial [Alphaproteobacteria bacterium]